MKRDLLDPNQDRTWREIIDTIVEQLDDEDVPEHVIEATELLLSGYPTREVAKKLNVTSSKVRSWIRMYPKIAAVLADSRASLIRWRLNQLDRQFLSAVKKSNEILDVPLSGGDADAKILASIGQHVRYIMSLFAGQKIDVRVTHGLDDTLLQAKQDALEYLAEQLRSQADEQEPITTTYRVIDAKLDSGPLLKEDGEPQYGQLGKIEQDERGHHQCHICGKYYKHLQKHIAKHQIAAQTYELTFMLEPKTLNQLKFDKKNNEK